MKLVISLKPEKGFVCCCSHPEELMMRLNELTIALNALSAQLTKATGEILAKIEALEAALADAEIPDAAIALLDELKDKAQALDDIVPDAPEPTPDA
jgi:hypothetical protein